MNIIDSSYILKYLPKRDKEGCKYSFGIVLCIAGSPGYTGAPYFSALSSQISGCGIVRLLTPKSIWSIEATKLNEVIVVPTDEDEQGVISLRSLTQILNYAEKSDAVLIGPGCGRSNDLKQIIIEVMNNIKTPLVLDADAISILSDVKDPFSKKTCPIVITPHKREFERISHYDKEMSDEFLSTFAKQNDIYVVYKTATTKVITNDGEVFVNSIHSNSGMAKGGSGDILSGIITSFIAQKVMITQACNISVYLHSEAGMMAKNEKSERGMLPSDILYYLPKIFKKYEE